MPRVLEYRPSIRALLPDLMKVHMEGKRGFTGAREEDGSHREEDPAPALGNMTSDSTEIDSRGYKTCPVPLSRFSSRTR